MKHNFKLARQCYVLVFFYFELISRHGFTSYCSYSIHNCTRMLHWNVVLLRVCDVQALKSIFSNLQIHPRPLNLFRCGSTSSFRSEIRTRSRISRQISRHSRTTRPGRSTFQRESGLMNWSNLKPEPKGIKRMSIKYFIFWSPLVLVASFTQRRST